MNAKASFVVVLGFLLFLAAPWAAHADSSPHSSGDSAQDIWPAVTALISHCAIRTYTIQDGRKVYGYLRPTCDDLKLDNQRAYLQISGQWYMATIEDAADSDGGDLNNVYVFDSNGTTVAQRREVLAFGDILLALSGGRIELPEVYVQN